MLHIKQSFPPLLCNEPQVLILGSIPGDRSIEMQQYYGHPQNRFWRVLAMVFEADIPANYEEKKGLLADNNIALWDVAHRASRKGSMDSAIRDEEPNDIVKLLAENKTIQTIAFNGKKAEQLFDRYFERFPNIRYLSMPSTSPANAACGFEKLCKHWKQIII